MTDSSMPAAFKEVFGHLCSRASGRLLFHSHWAALRMSPSSTGAGIFQRPFGKRSAPEICPFLHQFWIDRVDVPGGAVATSLGDNHSLLCRCSTFVAFIHWKMPVRRLSSQQHVAKGGLFAESSKHGQIETTAEVLFRRRSYRREGQSTSLRTRTNPDVTGRSIGALASRDKQKNSRSDKLEDGRTLRRSRIPRSSDHRSSPPPDHGITNAGIPLNRS